MDRAAERRQKIWDTRGLNHEKAKLAANDVGENRNWIRSINDFRNFKILEKHEKKKRDISAYRTNYDQIVHNKRANLKAF